MRQDLYPQLKMDEHYWGGAFRIDISQKTIETQDARLALLDDVCKEESLHAIGEHWVAFDFEQASSLLLNALRYDLAYSSARLANDEKSQYFLTLLLQGFGKEGVFCYTNWGSSLWDGKSAHGWEPLTENTFDMGIVFMNRKQLVFVWFISED